MREFRISEIGVEKTLAKAQKLAQRAQKKGLSGGYQVRIEKRFEESEGISHEYQVLVIEGEPVKFNGWQFIGVAEFVEGKAITKTIAGGCEVKPSEVKVGYCEHCQKVRARSTVIFVQNEEGKVCQVGSSCVKDYIGWQFSASYLPTEETFEEEFGGYSGNGWTGHSTVGVLAHAITQVEKGGYLPSGSGISTKSLVWEYLGGGFHAKNNWKEYVGVNPTEVEYEKARELIEYGKNFKGESSYAENVRVVCGLEYQTYSTIGILVSIIRAKQKSQEQEIARQEAKVYKAEQFAPTGERVELEVTVLSENTFETQFGWTTLYTFASGEYQFKWFASSGTNLQVGDKAVIKGTIKGSDEYKETFSTLITRCKVLQIAEKIA